MLSIPPEEPGIPDPEPETTAWVTPTLLNSWADYIDAFDQQVIQYRKVGDIVHIRGAGTGVSGAVFMLPAGYRPPATLVFPVVSIVGGEPVHNTVNIYTDGEVEAFTSEYMSFGTLMFSVTA